MQKTVGEVWDPKRLVIQVLITMFCMHKTTNEGWDPKDKRHSGSKHAVLHTQINRRSLGPLETSNSDANHAVLNAQNHR